MAHLFSEQKWQRHWKFEQFEKKKKKVWGLLLKEIHSDLFDL